MVSTNNDTNYKTTFNSLSCFTDHFANFIILTKFCSLPSNDNGKHNPNPKIDYSRLNESALNNDVQSIDWFTAFNSKPEKFLLL